MTIFHRRLIYVFFIIIFLVSAPLIILYTMGYRYNFAKGRVQKTGIIRITSVPRGADIYLNGIKYESSQTPAKIEKLLPGDYEIKLSKNGYYDWQKKLPVYENGTTFAEKVILWKKSTSYLLATTTASSWLTSPDKNIIAIASSRGNVSLLDINSGLFGEISGGNIETIADLGDAETIDLLSFSPTGRYLLTRTVKNNKGNYYLIDTLNKNSKKLPGQNYLSIKWEATTDNLYALNKTGLNSIDLASLKTQSVNKALPATDFYLNGKTIYFLSAGALYKQALDGGQPSLIEKINCPDCQISDLKNNRLILSNNLDKLLIIDLNRQVKTIEAAAKNLAWLNNSSLMFSNDHEIYIYNFSKKNPELITRLGTTISAASWQPNGRYLIVSSDDKISILELDNRELRNSTVIANQSAKFLTTDRAGNSLYFASSTGIGKLNLQ